MILLKSVLVAQQETSKDVAKHRLMPGHWPRLRLS